MKSENVWQHPHFFISFWKPHPLSVVIVNWLCLTHSFSLLAQRKRTKRKGSPSLVTLCVIPCAPQNGQALRNSRSLCPPAGCSDSRSLRNFVASLISRAFSVRFCGARLREKGKEYTFTGANQIHVLWAWILYCVSTARRLFCAGLSSLLFSCFVFVKPPNRFCRETPGNK